MPEDEADFPVFYTDPVAQRAAAFTVLLGFTNELKDEQLRGLSVLMLKQIINSISGTPQASEIH